MSKETENLKLFKYDSETDDFNTTTFNIKQCLNDNWDKIDLYLNNTQQQVNLKNEEQDTQINFLNFMSQVAGHKRTSKVDGVFEVISYYDKSNKLLAKSTLSSKNTSGFYTLQTLLLYSNPNNTTVTNSYTFDLIYDSEGDLIERKLK
ncbi:hypothetical protein FDB84_12255 [Clostridium sporogenes]|nr:hypothetical protein [Clostridium sporogenes]